MSVHAFLKSCSQGCDLRKWSISKHGVVALMAGAIPFQFRKRVRGGLVIPFEISQNAEG